MLRVTVGLLCRVPWSSCPILLLCGLSVFVTIRQTSVGLDVVLLAADTLPIIFQSNSLVGSRHFLAHGRLFRKRP